MHRTEMMKDSAAHHHNYYLQFATRSTRLFVLANIGLERLQSSNCPHFNDIVKNDGPHGWVWDQTPINTSILKSCGEINSASVRTCVAKAVATEILKEASR
jgi:hypothetical protein